MNIEKYTQNAQQVVVDCQNIASSMGHQMVDGEHVHLALLQQKDGLIPKLLKNMGVNVDALTKEVQAEVDKIPKVTGSADSMYGTRRINNIFVNAEKIAEQFLPMCAASLKEKNVIMHGDAQSRTILKDILPADDTNYATEYNDFEMNVRIVKDVHEAIAHIETFGTHHSDCIVTENAENVLAFFNGVDSACVYHNASTRFTDGGEFGLGAEIGISTQKLHARGPMGLKELTTYAYYLEGNGEIR